MRSTGLFRSPPPFCNTPRSERSIVNAAEKSALVSALSYFPRTTNDQWPRTSQGPLVDAGVKSLINPRNCTWSGVWASAPVPAASASTAMMRAASEKNLLFMKHLQLLRFTPLRRVRSGSDTLALGVKRQWAESRLFPYLPSFTVECRPLPCLRRAGTLQFG